MVIAGLFVAASVFGQVEGGRGRINPCDSVMVGQARAAVVELGKAEHAHRGERGEMRVATYEGTAAIEGHMMRPGMTRSVPVRMEFVSGRDGMKVVEVSGAAGSQRVETTLVLGGRVAEQAGAGFKEDSKEAALVAAADAGWWMPGMVASSALKAGPSGRVGAEVERDGVRWVPISFVDGAGRVCTALLDGEHRIGRVERLEADQRLGDVCNWVSFESWREEKGVSVPQSVSRFTVVDAATIRYDLKLVKVETRVEERDAFALPEERKGDIPDWGVASKRGMEFVSVAPRVWAIEIAAANSRVLVIEREKDLVTLGAPDGDAVCGDLVAVLKEKFPDKAIGLAAFGHHHPSPSGGLRALAAAGATVVAPRGLEEYVKELMSRPVGLGEPAVAGPRELKAEWFEGERVIECGGVSVRLIDIGEKSAHAFHYVVFYIPELGLVFEDDLGYFPSNGAARMSPRLAGLVGAFVELKIEPKRLIQAWPVKDVKREVEWRDVAALVTPDHGR